MISNYEFIKTQAFELSWAVFRCTELFSQDKLRKEVEAAAVDLIADSGTIVETLESEFPRIEKLTALIRLAESVGQIASVNANVLYRELDNLAKAIRLEVVDRREKKNITASLERMFSNSDYAENLSPVIPSLSRDPQPEFGKADSSVPQSTAPLGMTKEKFGNTNLAIQQSVDSQFGSIEQLLSAAAKSSQPITNNLQSTTYNRQQNADSANSNPLDKFVQVASVDVVRQNGAIRQAPASAPPSTFVIPAHPTSSGQAPAGIQHSATATVSSIIAPTRQSQIATTGSWQNVILQRVKDLGQTTTKELTVSFPEISERTIRFYLQKLVDNGAIDRVGTTGPGAAYKSRN